MGTSIETVQRPARTGQRQSIQLALHIAPTSQLQGIGTQLFCLQLEASCLQWSFLLTVDNFSLFTYNWSVFADNFSFFCLQLELSLLQWESASNKGLIT